jgi:casein kinase 1
LQDQKPSTSFQQQQQTPSNTGSKTQQGGNNVIGVHYKIGRKIGEGSFGIIYEGTAN